MIHSNARVGNHPIHPFLVTFPIAFYVSACAAYLYYAVSDAGPFWFRVGFIANIAGIITAVVAAVPGFIDWMFAVPAGSPAKKTGFYHLILNLITLAIFIACAVVSSNEYNLEVPNATWGVFLSVIGIGFMGVAGFLGGKMVSTHHIGVELSPEQEILDPQLHPHLLGKNMNNGNQNPLFMQKNILPKKPEKKPDYEKLI